MKFKKKGIFIGAIIFLGLLYALPMTRDALAWHWAESRDEASDYMTYFSDWPNGRHVAEAKTRYQQRTWKETERAMINEAIKKHAAAQANPDARQERKQRLEHFFWSQVTNENKIYSYKGYLQRYPSGEFAPEAQRRIGQLVERGETDTSAPVTSP